MGIYKVRIKKIEIRYNHIVVAASSAEDALDYCKNNFEWEDDPALLSYEGDGKVKEMLVPESAKEIKHETQLPRLYKSDSRPWNDTEGNKIKHYLKDT